MLHPVCSPILTFLFTPFDLLAPKYFFNRIDGVIVSVLASSVVDHGFEPQLGQTKDH
jgi:hypothetical protein